MSNGTYTIPDADECSLTDDRRERLDELRELSESLRDTEVSD